MSLYRGACDGWFGCGRWSNLVLKPLPTPVRRCTLWRGIVSGYLRLRLSLRWCWHRWHWLLRLLRYGRQRLWLRLKTGAIVAEGMWFATIDVAVAVASLTRPISVLMRSVRIEFRAVVARAAILVLIATVVVLVAPIVIAILVPVLVPIWAAAIIALKTIAAIEAIVVAIVAVVTLMLILAMIVALLILIVVLRPVVIETLRRRLIE